MHLQQRETDVCASARAPNHARQERLGELGVGYDELHVKLFEALFFFCSVLGLHPRLRLRAFTPLDDGTS
jgi:hypothetical protein